MQVMYGLLILQDTLIDTSAYKSIFFYILCCFDNAVAFTIPIKA